MSILTGISHCHVRKKICWQMCSVALSSVITVGLLIEMLDFLCRNVFLSSYILGSPGETVNMVLWLVQVNALRSWFQNLGHELQGISFGSPNTTVISDSILL